MKRWFNVMQTYECESAKLYRIGCQCGSEDCDLQLEVELDSEFSEVGIHMYQNLYYVPYWGMPSLPY